MSASRIPARATRFNAVVAALGEAAQNAKAENGWPGRLSLNVGRAWIDVSLHVSLVSSHARKPHEMRFQNPADATPVSDRNGMPVLIGIDQSADPTVFVAIDGRSRVRRRKRFSVLFNRSILTEARKQGWAVYKSQSGESIYAFVPALLPAFVEQVKKDEMLPSDTMKAAALASGLLNESGDTGTSDAVRRATRAVQVLVRKAGAGRKIRAAYAERCAMCALNSGLVEGAHIYPVEAPGSTDAVINGVALCRNHHGALDAHLIWVHPETKAIKLSPLLHDAARSSLGAKHLVESTLATLMPPRHSRQQPDASMFRKRYAYFAGLYAWALPRRKSQRKRRSRTNI